jgi:hypothetical protein
MEISIKLYINGKNFSPTLFKLGLPEGLPGEARSHRESKNEVARNGDYFHASREFEGTFPLEVCLSNFLNDYSSPLGGIRDELEIKKIVTIIIKSRHKLESLGLFLNKEILDFLNHYDLELDLEIDF